MRGCQGSPGGVFASLFLFLRGSDPAQAAADYRYYHLVLKVQAFALCLSWLVTQPRKAISFHQDSGFYSLYPDSSVRGLLSLSGHGRGVCKRISLAVGECELQPLVHYCLSIPSLTEIEMVYLKCAKSRCKHHGTTVYRQCLRGSIC